MYRTHLLHHRRNQLSLFGGEGGNDKGEYSGIKTDTPKAWAKTSSKGKLASRCLEGGNKRGNTDCFASRRGSTICRGVKSEGGNAKNETSASTSVGPTSKNKSSLENLTNEGTGRMAITRDEILNAVETESGLRGLLQDVVGALRFRATANNRDAQVAQANGNRVDAVRESHVADARIRNAELLAFVLDNIHSFEPPAVAAAAVATSDSAGVSAPVVDDNTSETGPEPESTVEATG